MCEKGTRKRNVEKIAKFMKRKTRVMRVVFGPEKS